MSVAIIGLIIGLSILAAGIYYLIKERRDQESRRIYTIASLLGALVAIVSALLLLL